MNSDLTRLTYWSTTTYLMMICFTCCIVKTEVTKEKMDLLNETFTQNITDKTCCSNYTNFTQMSKDDQYKYVDMYGYNITNITSEDNKTRNNSTETLKRKHFPIPLIAAPAVIVFIFIFLCVAYKWHSSQIDSQPKDMSMGRTQCSSCNDTQNLLPANPSPIFDHPRMQFTDELCVSGRKCNLTQFTQPVQGTSGSKNCDFSDIKQILPRRHSFLL